MSSKLEVVLAVTETGMDAFKNASDSIGNLKKETSSLNTVMVNMAATLNVAKAAYSAVSGAVKSTVLDSLSMADALDKQAKQANVSTTTLQEYGYAARMSGASTEAMTTALVKLTDNSYKAYTGDKMLAEGFRVLGVNLRDANGGFRDTDAVVSDTVAKLADLKNPAQQTALTIQLLGRGGKELLPMLREGSTGIDEMRKAATDMGQVLSESAIKNLDEMGDNLDTLSMRLKVTLAEGVNQAMPALEMLAGGLSRVMDIAAGAAQGWGWMLGGQKKFNDEMAKQDAITRELQDMIKLKKEYESIIGAQEAFKARQSGLFDEETLVSYKAALKDLNANIRDMGSGKKSGGTATTPDTTAPTGLGNTDEAEKAQKDAMKRMQDAMKADRDWQAEDAKARWDLKQKALQDEKEARDKMNREAEDSLKKHNSTMESLQSELAQAKIRNEKDQTKAAAMQWKENDRLAREGYRKTVQSAKGNAKEVALANEVMTENIKSNEAAYYEQVKQIEAQKKQNNIANAREQLDVLSGVLKEAAAKNKAAAVAYKTIAIATTAIDTYSGAQKAFNSLASIPYVGYALGLAAAGATVAAGLLRVNEIRKQQFVSGGESSGGMALVGEMGPEYVNLPRGSQVINHHRTSQMINNANRSSTVLNVTIQGSRGTASQQLVTEIRSGKSDYLLKQIAKAMGV